MFKSILWFYVTEKYHYCRYIVMILQNVFKFIIFFFLMIFLASSAWNEQPCSWYYHKKSTLIHSYESFFYLNLDWSHILFQNNCHFHFLIFPLEWLRLFVCVCLCSLPCGPGILRIQHTEWVSRTKLSLFPTDFSRVQETPKEETVSSNVLVQFTLAYLNSPPQ